MYEPTVTITLREFNELKDALEAAISFRSEQMSNDKNSSHYAEWQDDFYRWREMGYDYKKGMK